MEGMSRDNRRTASDPGKFPRFYEAIRAVHAHGILVVNPDGLVTVVTPEAARLLGLEARATDAHCDSLPVSIRETIARVNDSGKPVVDSFTRINSAESSPAALRISAFPLPCGGSKGAIVVVDDIEAARKLEHHLQRLDRLADIGTLAASMAHEIKNALVAGKTFIELLLEKHGESELTGVVKREIGRIDAIVSRMLKYAGGHEREFQALHVHELLQHSIRLVKPQMDSKNIVLSHSFVASADLVEGNENELQQAVVNLLLNALEAMNPGGTLSISTELSTPGGSGLLREGASMHQIHVLVADTGPGIEPDQLSRVFTPFFTTKPDGTGLGLAITQRIVQEHAGSITVESELNRGTRFCIALPLVDSCAPRS